MADLIIHDLDDAIVAKLEVRAKTQNRSLEAEVHEILTAAVDLRLLAERIAAMTPNVPQTDSTELLREDRRR
jgi:plasmid stability protein